MGGFKAESVVEKLDYDLRPFVDKHGTIPEPSDKVVRGFLRRVDDLAKQAAGDDKDQDADTASLLGSLSDEQYEQIEGDLAAAISELTASELSRDDYMGLPHRHRRAFVGWLLGELLDPTESTPATKGSRAGLRAV